MRIPPTYSQVQQRRTTRIAAAIGAFMAVLVIAAIVTSVSEALRRRALAAKVAPAIASLSKRYPYARFFAYPGDDATATTNISAEKCAVDGVSFSRNGASLDVTAHIRGVSAEPTAPDVYVALFTADGAFIERRAVVDFLLAELQQDATRAVSDTFTLSAEPAIFAVDDGYPERLAIAKQAAAPASAASRSAAYDDRPSDTDVRDFMDILAARGITRDVVVSARTRITHNHLEITMGWAYFYQPYQVRLQIARRLWRWWAVTRRPTTADTARVTLLDEMGNSVGGSSWLAGSLVSVDR